MSVASPVLGHSYVNILASIAVGGVVLVAGEGERCNLQRERYYLLRRAKDRSTLSRHIYYYERCFYSKGKYGICHAITLIDTFDVLSVLFQPKKNEARQTFKPIHHMP